MVWGFFPVDSSPGEDKYYIYAKGAYKVGRKGCDIIVNKDKGVSRIHAEIVVGAVSSKVKIKDCSKYGTFITRSVGTKEKVHELPNKETTLEDGDVVSFGTGNATYRLCIVPLVFFICCSEVNLPLQNKVSSIGAHVTPKLNQECTHVLVDRLTPVKEDLLDAVVANKPIVLNSWVEYVADKPIHTEIPSCNSHLPTLMVEGVSIKFADPKTRDSCLEGYTFLIESAHMYKFGDRLKSLLEVCGAKVLSIRGFDSSSQGSKYEDNRHVVCVIPRGSAEKFDSNKKLSSLSRVNEMDLICAILTGHLDPSILTTPPAVVSSSCSTDETVVADSDAETETEAETTSVHAVTANKAEEDVKDVNKVEISKEVAASISGDIHVTSVKNSSGAMTARRDKVFESKSGNLDIISKSEDSHVISFRNSSGAAGAMTARREEVDKSKSGNPDIISKSEDSNVMSFRHSSGAMTARGDKVDESEGGNPDIIYSQNLIVRDTNSTATISSRLNNEVINFKHFTKTNTQSGNSFNNLVPFSKYPYKDSEYGNEDIVESLKEEKKRKQKEAVAEDLFYNEKARRRGAAGSIHGLLTRR